jgi:hypothetical protein
MSLSKPRYRIVPGRPITDFLLNLRKAKAGTFYIGPGAYLTYAKATTNLLIMTFYLALPLCDAPIGYAFKTLQHL